MPGSQSRDERKSGHEGLVGDAYGNGGGSANNPGNANPFTLPGSPFRRSGGSTAGGFPLGGGSAPAVEGATSLHAVPPAVTASNGITPGIISQLVNQFATPKGVMGLASLLPMLTSRGGGNNPFSGAMGQQMMDEILRSLALQRQRVEQAQPVYDNLVRMATASAPNANYGGPAYQYQPPRLGG